MKKFSCILIVFAILACDHNDAKPGANPEVIAKHQAPFGVSAVDVKLRKVYLNDAIAAEYFYEGDQLIEFKGYSPGGSHQLYLNGIMTRNGKMPDQYTMKAAEISWPGGMVFYPPQPAYTMNFIKSIQDSVRYVSITSHHPSSAAAIVVYRFGKNGYLLQSDRGADVPAGYTVVYERDANHNIPESYGTTFSKVEKSPSTKYAFDNHPNPFFKLGIDLEGRFSVRSLSVNNVVREEIPEKGQPSVWNYAYEYLPNGYPSKVTMTGIPENGPFTWVYKFEY
jgi:hypothetical protein